LALLGVFLLSLAVGSVNIPLSDVLRILTGGEPACATWGTIVLDFRLPKALTALLAGAALASSGSFPATRLGVPCRARITSVSRLGHLLSGH
jgi:ABC-type Fe3+-siderophore transport system permease subunit